MSKQSIHIFYGTENYLIEEEINKLINKLIPIDERDLNLITYDLNTTPLNIVIEEAETLPFFSKHKLVVAKNATFFTGQKPPKNIEHDIDSLVNFLDNPVEYSTIIFTIQAEKLDERKKIVKKIKKFGNTKAYSLLSGNSLADWIKKTTHENKASITDEAANLLIQIIGSNLQLLSQEISKMAIFVGDKGLIDRNVIENLSVRTIEQNIFTLIEKVANLEIEDAFRIFYDLLKNKEEPIKIVALFSRQFRLMLYSKELHRIGYSAQQIASQLSAHPYSIQMALKQSTKFDEGQLKAIIKNLAEMDFNMKTGKMDKILSLEMFMFRLKSIAV